MPRVSVLMPTYNHGQLIRCAYQSLAQQTEQDFELFIICDGATAETTTTAEAIAASDTRVQVRHYPKSPRTGEPYRHDVISEHARGEFICYLSDDDLWLPDHLQRLCQSLEEADFSSSQCVNISPNNDAETYAVDLGLQHYRQLLLGNENRVPLSTVAHRRATYLGLPHGWRTTPAGKSTDHYMWQQWLAQDGLRFSAVAVPTVINFPSPQRNKMTLVAREHELSCWLERMRSDEELAELRHFLYKTVVRSLTARVARLEAVQQRLFFRIANRLHRALFGNT
jgi:glycosyltransferase involved in cell wall biosynthesis